MNTTNLWADLRLRDWIPSFRRVEDRHPILICVRHSIRKHHSPGRNTLIWKRVIEKKNYSSGKRSSLGLNHFFTHDNLKGEGARKEIEAKLHRYRYTQQEILEFSLKTKHLFHCQRFYFHTKVYWGIRSLGINLDREAGTTSLTSDFSI